MSLDPKVSRRFAIHQAVGVATRNKSLWQVTSRNTALPNLCRPPHAFVQVREWCAEMRFAVCKRSILERNPGGGSEAAMPCQVWCETDRWRPSFFQTLEKRLLRFSMERVSRPWDRAFQHARIRLFCSARPVALDLLVRLGGRLMVTCSIQNERPRHHLFWKLLRRSNRNSSSRRRRRW